MEFNKNLSQDYFPLYIDGKFTDAISGETREAICPATGEVFATYAYAAKDDVSLAIKAARRAFDSGAWSGLSTRERGAYLLRAREELEKRLDQFVIAETKDCGKMYPGVKHFDMVMALDAFTYYAGKARSLEGKVVPINPQILNYVARYPYGVVGEILPWNGPLMMGCQKIAAILAAGNTVVVKPSSEANISMLMLAQVFDAANFPPGVVNFVTGPGKTVGNMLVESPEVDMVSLTGGTSTGRQLISASVQTIKPLALELGGKSANIIFEDVDMEKTAKWAYFGFTNNSGQVCVSGTRIFVQKKIYEPFLELLAQQCATAVPGDGFDFMKGVNFQTLISKEHASDVWKYIESGICEGARLVCGGKHYTDPHLMKGNFVPPTVFADVTPDMKIFQEEIFGPVACVLPFDTEEEAIELANCSDYGLAGAVFSRDGARALRVAAKIQAGQIYVNQYFSPAMIESAGTGWKHSGLGVAGIDKYTTTKTTFVNLRPEELPF